MGRLRLLEVPKDRDVQEFLFEKEVTDGLPVVPCTRAKLEWMLTGTDLPPDAVLGKMPPVLASCTVTSVAINAVMAGCHPRHLRIVVAAVRAALEPDFNLHGCHATTMGTTPVVIVNGKNVTKSSSLNYSHGALGSGQNNRANACIGRALKLVLQNCGRARLGGTESTTIGGYVSSISLAHHTNRARLTSPARLRRPRKYTMCLVENADALALRTPAWNPFRGDGEDVVTVHSMSSGVDQLVDFKMTRSMFVDAMGAKIANLWNVLPAKISECVVVVSPEHYFMLHDSGVSSKKQLQRLLFDAANVRAAREIPNAARLVLLHNSRVGIVGTEIAVFLSHLLAGIIASFNLLAPVEGHSTLGKCLLAILAFAVVKLYRTSGVALVAVLLACGMFGVLAKIARTLSSVMPKMNTPSSIHIVVSGSMAGKFSCVFPGFGCVRRVPSSYPSIRLQRVRDVVILPALYDSISRPR